MLTDEKRNKYRLNIANTSMAIIRRKFSIGMGGLATASIPRIPIAQQSRLAVGVVGGGIVGASIALHLARAGVAVTVFEKTKLASGATGKSLRRGCDDSESRVRAIQLSELQAAA